MASRRLFVRTKASPSRARNSSLKRQAKRITAAVNAIPPKPQHASVNSLIDWRGYPYGRTRHSSVLDLERMRGFALTPGLLGGGASGGGGGGGSPPAVVFDSDWSTALGGADTAIFDGSKWVFNTGSKTQLTVVQADVAGLADSPSINVLKVLNLGGITSGGAAFLNNALALWTNPQIGESRYYRVYLRNDIANDEGDRNDGAASYHPLQMSTGAGGTEDGLSFNFGALSNGTFDFNFETNNTAFPKNHWSPVDGSGAQAFLNKFAFYRYEWKLTKTGTNTYTLDARIYDNTNTLVYQATTIRDRQFTGTLAATGTGLGLADTSVTYVVLGTNGGGILNSMIRDEPTYWAAFQVRSDTWCGAYVRPTLPLFQSVWDAATGNAVAAYSDGNKWSDFNFTAGLNVVSTGAAGGTWPIDMNNVLDAMVDGVHSPDVHLAGVFTTPTSGNSVWYRTYIRAPIPENVVSNSNHCIEPNSGTPAFDWGFLVQPNSATTWYLQFYNDLNGSAHRYDLNTNLDQGMVYRLEWQFKKLAGANAWQIFIRIYDASDTLLYTEANFIGLNSEGALSGIASSTIAESSVNGDLLLGVNGLATAASRHLYFGGVALRTDNWCGPYVRPIPVFESIWSTATGASDPARTDGAKWVVTNDSNQLNVLTAASAGLSDAPSPNVLRVTNKAGSNPSTNITFDHLWDNPQVGESRYFRLYMRNDVANDEGNQEGNRDSHHPFQQAGVGGNEDFEWTFAHKNDGTQAFAFSPLNTANPKNHFCPTSSSGVKAYLAKFAFLRYEWKYTKTALNTYSLDARIYDAAGNLLYDNTTLRASNLTTTLLVGGVGLTTTDGNLGKGQLGSNGGTAMQGLIRDEYIYYAAMCVRRDDWCGPLRPPPVLRSEWNFATGVTDNALADGVYGSTGKWSTIGGTFVQSAPILKVITAASMGLVDAPTTNVLQVNHDRFISPGNTASGEVAVGNLWDSPQVGESRYWRVYHRTNVADDEGDLSSGVNSHHPLAAAIGSDIGNCFTWRWAPLSDGTFIWLFDMQGEADPNQRWKLSSNHSSWTTLPKAVFLRFEWKLTRTGVNAYTLQVRVYNMTGLLLYDNTTLSNNNFSSTLAAYGLSLFHADSEVGKFQLGTNGGSLFGNLLRVEQSFYAGVCVRKDDWPGPYSQRNG